MVLIEAMSNGVPLIAFDCPRGPAEIIRHGQNGLLIPEGPTRRFGAALRRLVEDADLRERLGAQALRDAEATAEDLRMYRNVGSVLVHAIQHQPQIGPGPVLDKIAETTLAIKAHRGRLDAMCHAALDAARARALVASATHLWGKPFTLDPLVRSDGALFGWVVESAIGKGE